MTTAILFDRDGVERLADLDDRPRRLRGSRLLWVDVDGGSTADARRAAATFRLDDESEQRLVRDDADSRFRDKGQYVHVTLSSPRADADDELTRIECVVGDNWVVTAHRHRVQALEDYAELAGGSGRTGDLDGATFLANLIEWVLGEHASAFERIEAELERVDARAMRGERDAEDEIEQLVALRGEVGTLRRSLTSHRSLLLALAHTEYEALGDESSALRFQRLLERYESTLNGARDARESIVGSFDVLIARTGYRTNEIVKILTLASVVFLPGALIAGVMGMNFKVGLFEHTVLFWIVLALIVAIGTGTVVVARVRRWI